MVQGRLEISARKNPLEVNRKSARVPPADSARKNPLEVSRKSARVAPYTTVGQVNKASSFGVEQIKSDVNLKFSLYVSCHAINWRRFQRIE